MPFLEFSCLLKHVVGLVEGLEVDVDYVFAHLVSVGAFVRVDLQDLFDYMRFYFEFEVLEQVVDVLFDVSVNVKASYSDII